MARPKGSKNKAPSAAKPKGRGSRKSKAESMTGAKDDEVEVRTIGDNSGELDLTAIVIDERDFKLHYNSIKTATDKKETAMSLLRTARKRAKEASPDILDAVERAMSFERMDQDTLKREFQIAGYALKATDSPIQLTLHNTLLGDAVEQAAKRGRKAGEAGDPCASPYPAGSDLDKAYSDNWTIGQGVKVGLTEKQAAAAIGGDAEGGEREWPDDAEVNGATSDGDEAASATA